MSLTAGMRNATGSWTALPARVTSVPMWLARNRWIPMGSGATIRNMDRYGFPTKVRTGPRIRMGAGCTRITTVGVGLAPSRGVGLLITMGSGTGVRGVGLGGRAPLERRFIGGRRWWDFSAGAGGSASVLDLVSPTSVGCRLRRLKRSTPGTAEDSPAAA